MRQSGRNEAISLNLSFQSQMHIRSLHSSSYHKAIIYKIKIWTRFV